MFWNDHSVILNIIFSNPFFSFLQQKDTPPSPKHQNQIPPKIAKCITETVLTIPEVFLIWWFSFSKSYFFFEKIRKLLTEQTEHVASSLVIKHHDFSKLSCRKLA